MLFFNHCKKAIFKIVNSLLSLYLSLSNNILPSNQKNFYKLLKIILKPLIIILLKN